MQLRNGEKLKDFKLNAISEQGVTEQELRKLQRENKHLKINRGFVNSISKSIKEASSFTKDKD